MNVHSVAFLQKMLREHLTVVHNFTFVFSEHKFESIDEYYSWKKTYEENKYCNFSKSTGGKLLKNDDTKDYFCCHMSENA